jgi:cell division protein FtsQ
MTVTAPADKRFRRAHLKPARKRAGLRLRRWRAALVAALIGTALYAGHRAVAIAADFEMFHVNEITVRGHHRLSQGEVLALLDDLRGRSIFFVDLAEWRRALLSSPWVADASLHKTLPSTVDVVIVERTALGIGRINGALYVVDDRGAIIDDYGPNYADLDLPIIDGLTGHSSESTSTGPVSRDANADVQRALLAGRLLDALRARNMAGQISQINVSDSRNAVVLLDGDSTLIRLGDERFVERLQSYYELAPALRDRVPSIDYVDLRFDERVYVRPTRQGQRPSEGAGAAPARRGRPTQRG